MTTTYDPEHPQYFDAADTRQEMDRVFDLCHGCRLCWNLCPSFESLFDLIDNVHGDDPKALTDADHKRIVAECYQCKLCYLKCPYVPPHEWELDFPRLMARALAVDTKHNPSKTADGMARRMLASTDLAGKAGSALAPVANWSLRSAPVRKVMEKVVGIASPRLLPDYAKQRFSAWFRRRAKPAPRSGAPAVALFTTCIVEYQEPAVGHDLVKVYEHNGIDVALPDGMVCCGMPWIDAGNLDKFRDHAQRNVDALRAHVDAGRTIVVPQPTCGYVLKKEYPATLKSDDARAVAAATKDACEYLMACKREGTLDTNFTGSRYDSITWHAACHLRAQQIGYKSRDLMALTGAKVTVVERCSGIDGTWGLRAENYEMAKKVARPLIEGVEKAKVAGSELIAGDCHLANGAITEETGQRPVHPIQVIARAYGIAPEQ